MCAVLVLGCGPTRPPNVVLITLDTTRADHLPTYGYFRDTAPALDALARESVVFERLVVPMATTLPTHVSILTGTYPLEHGVLANSTQGGRRFVPSQGLRSFASLSRQAGYTTAAFVSAAPLKRGSGAEEGFDVFDEPMAKQRTATETTDAVLAWLGQHREGPFLLWVHYYDPHHPFVAPEPFASMFETDDRLRAYLAERKFSPVAPRPLVAQVDVTEDVNNLYDAEIRYTDSQVARVLDALRSRGDWDATAVVVVGDHGEGLGQHGLAAHGSTWHEQLHAPLFMRVPGEAPRRVDVQVSVIDVLPTLLGRLDAPQHEAFMAQSTGRDALAPDFERVPILSQDTGRERPEPVPYRYSLSDDRWKFFRLEHRDGSVTEELYDHEHDPYELQDVAAEHPEVHERLQAALAEKLASLSARGRALRGDGAATRAEDRAIIEQLEALGYVEGEEPEKR